MNVVVLTGRLTKDPNVRSTGEGKPVADFTLAVDRRGKRVEGQQNADFIRCVTFGKTAEVVEKYVGKGRLIGVRGRIQTGSYTNREGAKVYTTDVIVDDLEFLGSKSEGGAGNAGAAPAGSAGPAPADLDPGFEIPDEDEELPFA